MDSIVLAFMKEEISQKIKRMLDSSGIFVSGICHSKDEIMRFISDLEGGVVITGFKLPDATANDVYADLPKCFSHMVIISSNQQPLISSEEIFVLTLPTNGVELASSVNLLIKSHSTNKKKKSERKEIENKIIQQAKLILMERHIMTEEQAHRFIQKRSMDTGSRMIDIARIVLS